MYGTIVTLKNMYALNIAWVKPGFNIVNYIRCTRSWIDSNNSYLDGSWHDESNYCLSRSRNDE